jgi:hypothetical protein
MVTLKSEIWVFHRLPGYFKNKLGLSVRVWSDLKNLHFN